MNGSGLTKTARATSAARATKAIKPVMIRRVCGACGKRHDPTAKDKDGKPISCHQHARNVKQAIAVIRELIKHPAKPIRYNGPLMFEPAATVERAMADLPIEPANQSA